MYAHPSRALSDLCQNGLFTFGGGYAILALIEDSCVARKKWITHEEMLNITVIAESTPGPIAINCATYVGYKQAGFWGALIATLGIVLPSFLVIYCISLALALVLFGSRLLWKKKLSPILLILLSAVLGMVVYGL